jgi:hypothetical protein
MSIKQRVFNHLLWLSLMTAMTDGLAETLNFNPDWRFIRRNVPRARQTPSMTGRHRGIGVK